MKYKHKKSGIIVEWDDIENQYSDSYSNDNSMQESVWLNKDMVEDSSEWMQHHELLENIKKLQDIPCLSINDVAKVYVTANRYNPSRNEGLEKQGKELIEIVKKKVEQQEVEYRKIAEDLKTTRL